MAGKMPGGEYLQKLWKETGPKLKSLIGPLLKDGIGDRMDRGNLWVVPGFTLFVFSILWATKLSKIALEESTCKGASIYDLTGSQLDTDAIRHCQTATRYYVAPNEAISFDTQWREARQVKNPEWILYFWAPIVFMMYVWTRFMWTLLLENQGINFGNIVGVAQLVVSRDNEHGITDVDQKVLADRLHIVAENFRTAFSSRAFTAFVAFEACLVLAPLSLLLGILPMMIGGRYRTWGFDIARAWSEHREWQGSPLAPFFDFLPYQSVLYPSPAVNEGLGLQQDRKGPLLVPLFPRNTFCDYNFVTLGNTHTLTYRCYIDSNWHERTALFTWVMLAFLIVINTGNLLFWLEWAIRMQPRASRGRWVIKKWINTERFSSSFSEDDDENGADGKGGWGTEKPNNEELMKRFAEQFNLSQLLLFYYIEAHTDRVVASAFCTALYARWLEREKRRLQRRRMKRELKQRSPSTSSPSYSSSGSSGSEFGGDQGNLMEEYSEKPWPQNQNQRTTSSLPGAGVVIKMKKLLQKKKGKKDGKKGSRGDNRSPHSAPLLLHQQQQPIALDGVAGAEKLPLYTPPPPPPPTEVVVVVQPTAPPIAAGESVNSIIAEVKNP